MIRILKQSRPSFRSSEFSSLVVNNKILNFFRFAKTSQYSLPFFYIFQFPVGFYDVDVADCQPGSASRGHRFFQRGEL